VSRLTLTPLMLRVVNHCGSPRWLGRRRDGGDAENSDGGALAGEGENAVVSD
jgi:hypothetical protein